MKEISRWNNGDVARPEPLESAYVRPADTDEVEIKYYLNVLIKNRRLLIAVFMTVFIIGAHFALTATSMYEASSMLKIEPQNPSVTGVEEMLRLNEAGPY